MENPKKAFILVTALLALIVAVPLTIFSVRHIQQETTRSIQQSKSDTAYHLAESGQDRASYFINKSSSNWNALLAGTTFYGYDGNVTYDDVEGGLYKISIQAVSGGLTVLTKGKDSIKNQVRLILSSYTATMTSTATLGSGGLVIGGTLWEDPSDSYTHWTEVRSFGAIDSGSSCTNRRFWPFKRSASTIEFFIPDVADWCDVGPSPNYDPTEGYSAMDATVQPPPAIDFDYYKALAKTMSLSTTSWSCSVSVQSSSYSGTGYFDLNPGGSRLKFNNSLINQSTSVIYVEQAEIEITGTSFLRLKALINKTKNMKINSTGALAPNPYIIPVPADAWKQYAACIVYLSTQTSLYPSNSKFPDTAYLNEYPGDGGYHTSLNTYSIPGKFETAIAMSAYRPAFHGFLYTYNLTSGVGSSNGIFVGVIYVQNNKQFGNQMVIYYDPTVSPQLIGSSSSSSSTPPIRSSWNEVTGTW